MSKPFEMVTKSAYAALPTKETDVMYIITEQNQVSSVEVNSKSLNDYVLVKFYDPEDNNRLLSVHRAISKEELIFPKVEALFLNTIYDTSNYKAILHWATQAYTELPLEETEVPETDVSYFVFRSFLTIEGSCEVVIQGNDYKDQSTISKIVVSFAGKRIYMKEKKYANVLLIPKIDYNTDEAKNYISFYILNHSSLEEYNPTIEFYLDEQCSKYIGSFPLNIKVTTSNESTGD